MKGINRPRISLSAVSFQPEYATIGCAYMSSTFEGLSIRLMRVCPLLIWLAIPAALGSDPSSSLQVEMDKRIDAVLPQVVAWRRDIHQHPELSNREVRTAGLVAAHLRSLGIPIRTNIAHTGVVGVLRGGAGPVVALRADMDALPVLEMVDVPFRSKVRARYNGHEVGVMHACGHDNHVAILLGTATVLAGMRDDLPGTVVFIFQPAEEGQPEGEEGGAELMIKEGALEDPIPEAIFGLHVWPSPAGHIGLCSGPIMAGTADLAIVVQGKQTHAAQPWLGVDPIVIASQIVLGIQTITSRQLDLRKRPAVISIGSIQGGNRGNIIPDRVEMRGTIRTFLPGMEEEIKDRIARLAQGIAQSAGATAEVRLPISFPPTVNDPGLTRKMIPTLRRVAGDLFDSDMTPVTTAEDFALFAKAVPGMYFFLGVVPAGQNPATAAPNHSPYFYADESALPVGVRAMSHLAVDFLTSGGFKGPPP